MNRRDFIKFLGTASGATLVTSCRLKEGTDKLIPYLIPPEDEIVPGQAIYYSTTCTECPAYCGVSAKIREKIQGTEYKRYPIKLEGIVGHPINDGALCVRGQSSLTRLYNPSRIKEPLVRDSKGRLRQASWEEAFQKIIGDLDKSKEKGYENYFLSSRTTSFISDLIDTFCSELSIERLPEFELFSYSAIRRANDVLFARSHVPCYRIDESDLLLTVGADILETHISPVYNALLFSYASKKESFKWYHVEPHLSLTGLKSTDRLQVNPGTEVYLLLFLINVVAERKLGKYVLPEEIYKLIPSVSLEETSQKTGVESSKLKRLLFSISRAERPVVVVGGVSTRHALGLEVAVLGGLLQWMLGETGTMIDFSRRENYDRVGSLLDIEELSTRVEQGRVGVIFFSRLSQLSKVMRFKGGLGKPTLAVSISDSLGDVTKDCDVILPLSHTLESWGVLEPRIGLKTLVQPVLQPLYNTLSEGDILIKLIWQAKKKWIYIDYQEYIFARLRDHLDEKKIEELLERGYLENEVERVEINLNKKTLIEFLKGMKLDNNLKLPTLIITPSIRAYDGRSRDLPLLSEIPDPLATISYGKWVLTSGNVNSNDKIKDGEEIQISTSSGKVELPARVMNNIKDDVYTINIEMTDELKFNYDRKTGEIISYYSNINVSRTHKKGVISLLTGSFSNNEREILSPEIIEEQGERRRESLYPKHEHKDYRWAIAIDLDRCTGCSACVAACYIENNIPVVGVNEHIKGREMSWIRIEQHVNHNGRTQFIPMMCQQCDNAPCEPVCPVFASYHNPEGLNAQIYNRCVGTRYCSNNCPYKVRRFNWFHHEHPEPLDKMINPDVSVRDKGVMEKCTFCVQRIRAAKDAAKDESRKVRDGEITPACAQTCPTRAIVFGNILDKESEVYKEANSEKAHRIFEPLGTEPAIYYLKKDD